MNLENRFFYRLVNAIYYFLIIIACLIVVIVAMNVGFWWGALTVGIFYSIINICKESLIYVAFGKKLSWEWLFNIKRILLTLNNYRSKRSELTLAYIAEIPSHILFINDGVLCYDWKPKTINISQELHDTAWYASVVYSFYIYFLLIRNKFGKEISSIAKQYFNIFLDGKGDAGVYLHAVIGIIDFISEHHELPEVNLLAEDSSEEYKTACHFLITFPQSPYYLPDETRRHITYGEMDAHCGEDAITTIMQCFSHAKKQSILIFKPIIEKIDLKPKNISGLNIKEELAWSNTPACFEKHLQRKSDNPLFSKKQRKISQEDIDKARERDFNEINLAKEKVKNVMREFQELVSSENTTFRQIGDLREKIEKLMELNYKIGGAALSLNEGLKLLRNDIVDLIKKSLANEVDLLESFNKAEAFNSDFMSKFHDPFVQQVIREDSPITPDLAASVLSEDIKTILKFRDVAVVKDKKTEAGFKRDILNIVKAMHARGETLPMLNEKLALLGVSL